jgi:hypothetical protein
MNILLADHHEFGGSHLPLILIAAAVVVAGIALVAVFFRRSAAISSSQPPCPSDTLQTPVDGKTKMPNSGVFSEILKMLNQKGCPVEQSEIAANQGLTEDEVARALADLEQSGLVQRTWDREKGTYVVEVL